MYQANTLDTTPTGDRKARIAVEKMQERFLEGWECLGKLLFSWTETTKTDHAPDAQPLSGYYTDAHDRVSAAVPVASFHSVEQAVRGRRR